MAMRIERGRRCTDLEELPDFYTSAPSPCTDPSKILENISESSNPPSIFYKQDKIQIVKLIGKGMKF